MIMRKITLAFLLIFVSYACGEKDEKEIPFEDNPCAATLCIVGSTCINVPDPNSCVYPPPPQQEPCRKRAMCVPYGSAQRCGPSGEFCLPGQTCEFVQVQCIRAPCPPLLMCVDKTPNALQP